MTNQEAIGQLRCNVEGDYVNLDDLMAFDIAIKALEKQIPKKPLNPCGRYFNKAKGGNCPCCGAHTNSLMNNYCRKCGQALDWSEE